MSNDKCKMITLLCERCNIERKDALKIIWALNLYECENNIYTLKKDINKNSTKVFCKRDLSHLRKCKREGSTIVYCPKVMHNRRCKNKLTRSIQLETLENSGKYIKLSDFIIEGLIFIIVTLLSENLDISVIISFLAQVIRPCIAQVSDHEMCVLVSLITYNEFNEKEFDERSICQYYKKNKNECIYNIHQLNCPYKSGEYHCGISKKGIRKAIRSLLSKGVIRIGKCGNYVRVI